MKQFDRTNTGTLGRNTRKEKDSHPDFTGQININGVDYWLSGWTKTAGPQAAKPGSKFLSLSVKPKDGLAEPRPAPQAKVMTEDNWDKFDDADIPF